MGFLAWLKGKFVNCEEEVHPTCEQLEPRVLLSANSACFCPIPKPMMFLCYIEKNIAVKYDVWIGTHAIIPPGVTIEQGAIISVGAVSQRMPRTLRLLGEFQRRSIDSGTLPDFL